MTTGLDNNYNSLIRERGMSLDPHDPVFKAYHDVANSVRDLSKGIKTASRKLANKILAQMKVIAQADEYYRKKKYVEPTAPKPAQPTGESSPLRTTNPDDGFEL
jgi:uncharacterized protein YoxC